MLLNIYLYLSYMNYIIYGPPGSSKYKTAINICKKMSPTELKYNRKIELTLGENNYYFKITDVNLEIDFELLGTNEYNIWIAFYNMVKEICTIKTYYIICKNFHFIKDELIDIFHIFLRNENIKYIICTQYISCLPKILKEKCYIINNKIDKNNTIKNIDPRKRIEPIINLIYNQNTDFSLIREYLYEILTYNLNIHNVFTDILLELYILKYFDKNNICSVMDELSIIIKKYNNNYRSIFHLECFVIYLIKLKTSTISY